MTSLTYILHVFFIPFFSVIGVVGNVVSVMVFLRTRLRRRSSSLFLAAMATSDMAFLLQLLLRWLFHHDAFLDFRLLLLDSSLACKIINYIGNTTTSISVWLTVAYTVERCIAVQLPLRRSALCTVGRAKWTIFGVVLFSATINLYLLVTISKSRDKVCGIHLEYQHVMVVLVVLVDLVLMVVLPFLMIATMNTIIIIRLCQNSAHSEHWSGETALISHHPGQQTFPKKTPNLNATSVPLSATSYAKPPQVTSLAVTESTGLPMQRVMSASAPATPVKADMVASNLYMAKSMPSVSQSVKHAGSYRSRTLNSKNHIDHNQTKHFYRAVRCYVMLPAGTILGSSSAVRALGTERQLFIRGIQNRDASHQTSTAKEPTLKRRRSPNEGVKSRRDLNEGVRSHRNLNNSVTNCRNQNEGVSNRRNQNKGVRNHRNQSEGIRDHITTGGKLHVGMVAQIKKNGNQSYSTENYVIGKHNGCRNQNLSTNSNHTSAGRAPATTRRDHTRCHYTNSRDRANASLTKMLILISTVFIILQLPNNVIRIYKLFQYHSGPPGQDEEEEAELLAPLQETFLCLYYSHATVNFFLYILCGSSFRQLVMAQMKQLVNWGKQVVAGGVAWWQGVTRQPSHI